MRYGEECRRMAVYAALPRPNTGGRVGRGKAGFHVPRGGVVGRGYADFRERLTCEVRELGQDEGPRLLGASALLLALFTQVPRRGILGSPYTGSCIAEA